MFYYQAVNGVCPVIQDARRVSLYQGVNPSFDVIITTPLLCGRSGLGLPPELLPSWSGLGLAYVPPYVHLTSDEEEELSQWDLSPPSPPQTWWASIWKRQR